MRIAAPVLLLLLLAACTMTKGWQLEKAVTDALAKDKRTAAYTFDVSATDDGAVNITGELAVVGDLDVVTEIAKGVKGVTKVVNNCTYPEPSSGMLDDSMVPGVGGLL
jgi:hypothetical protein